MNSKYSYSSISRREVGELGVTAEYILDVCKALNLSKEESLQLVSSARVNSLRPLGKTDDAASTYAEIELNSKSYDRYSCEVVSRYLQTVSYALAMLQNYSATTSTESAVTQRVQKSQEMIKERSKKFRLIQHENSLYFSVAPVKVMVEQLEMLLKFQDEPNCELRILPREIFLPVPITKSFSLFDKFYCFCENRLDYSITDDDDTVERFQKDFETLWSHSVIGLRRNQVIEKAIGYYKSL